MFMNNYLAIMSVNDTIAGTEIRLFDVRRKYAYLRSTKPELTPVTSNDHKKVLQSHLAFAITMTPANQRSPVTHETGRI